MVFRIFISTSFLFRIKGKTFLFRTKGKKGHLDENEFRRYYGNFLESVTLKVACLGVYSKFCFSIYEANWQQHFERYLTVEDFTEIDQHMCEGTWKTWSNENQRRCMENYQLHKTPSLHLEEHCTVIEDDILLILHPPFSPSF